MTSLIVYIILILWILSGIVGTFLFLRNVRYQIAKDFDWKDVIVCMLFVLLGIVVLGVALEDRKNENKKRRASENM